MKAEAKPQRVKFTMNELLKFRNNELFKSMPDEIINEVPDILAPGLGRKLGAAPSQKKND